MTPVEDQADRRAHPQLTLFRTGQLAAEQAVAEPVEFGLTHGAQDAEQQAVGVLAGSHLRQIALTAIQNA
jgi:hypothetical protein